jgi:citronellol/citronellal dehydrogenase
VNARATFLCSQAAIAHLKKSPNAHILTLSPPLNMNPKWFAGHVAYTIAKYGMSMCTLGMAEEYRREGIAVNSLWPRTTIATAAVEVHFPRGDPQGEPLPGDHGRRGARDPHERRAKATRGISIIDEDVLRGAGTRTSRDYAVTPGVTLWQGPVPRLALLHEEGELGPG